MNVFLAEWFNDLIAVDTDAKDNFHRLNEEVSVVFHGDDELHSSDNEHLPRDRFNNLTRLCIA